MGKLPFTDYDFWAYLSAGFLFLVACDHAHGTDWMVTHQWSVTQALVATTCAYVVGQIIAGLASALIERCFTKRLLGVPIDILMGLTSGPELARWLIPSYYRPLPSETLAIIAAKANLPPGHSDALFWIAFTAAKENEKSMQRIVSFQNLYGMCRNLSLTFLAGAALISAGAYSGQKPADFYLVAVGCFLGVGMYLRYLKFYRHYILEILTTFAYAK
jgi:hypothetical protein